MHNLPYSFAKKHNVILTEVSDNSAKVAMYGTPTPATLSELKRHLQCQIKYTAVTQEEFNNLLEQNYQQDSQQTRQIAQELGESSDLDRLMDELPKTEDLLESDDDAPIIRLLNALFTQAIKQQASDIHIETFEDKLVVRFRIDGVLQEVLQPQRALAPLLVSRIKVMAKLDIAEKRLPQDGRIALRIAGRAVDVRVSTLPSNHGERVVLRILDQKAAKLNLTDLGMPEVTIHLLKKLLSNPHGIILVTGPTGAGKSTSLYAMLTELNKSSQNILTVEDPIEYDLPGIGQTQVNPKVDMTFAKGLRAILRQDPDIVMVGEIRDVETANIAVQASLTGHLVLSTLHTNTAIGAITRLKDMGVEPFLLSSSLIGVVAQRLVRLLCDDCKQPVITDPAMCKVLGLPENSKNTIYQANGCEQCNNTGYKGRTGIYELIAIDDQLCSLINNSASEQQLGDYARQQYPSIRHDGINKVLAGLTTITEVLRVAGDASEMPAVKPKKFTTNNNNLNVTKRDPKWPSTITLV